MHMLICAIEILNIIINIYQHHCIVIYPDGHCHLHYHCHYYDQSLYTVRPFNADNTGFSLEPKL